MFKKTRIKLTTWYSLIIMLISLSFSVVIYEELTMELNRFDQIQSARIQRGFPEINNLNLPPEVQVLIPKRFALDPDLIQETKDRLILNLGLINLVILGISSAGGYFLAGRTLKPIADMVDEQNRFISDASHELRTPLTAIKTEIEVALRDKNIKLSGAKFLLKSNLEEVNKIQRLTNNLLTINKFRENKTEIQFTQLNFKTIVEKSLQNMLPMIKAKNITLNKELKSASLLGNENSLIELAGILLDNAIKYSKRNGEIIAKTKTENGQSVFSVQDFGVGIDSKDLPHIFDRFYRADVSRNKEKTDGFGLGLSIAKNIVNIHKGKITVKSSMGKGTTITVSI